MLVVAISLVIVSFDSTALISSASLFDSTVSTSEVSSSIGVTISSKEFSTSCFASSSKAFSVSCFTSSGVECSKLVSSPITSVSSIVTSTWFSAVRSALTVSTLLSNAWTAWADKVAKFVVANAVAIVLDISSSYSLFSPFS